MEFREVVCKGKWPQKRVGMSATPVSQGIVLFGGLTVGSPYLCAVVELTVLAARIPAHHPSEYCVLSRGYV